MFLWLIKMADEEEEKTERTKRETRKCSQVAKILMKEEKRAILKEVTSILKKAECDRTEAELTQLKLAADVVKIVEKRAKLQKTRKDRLLETEDAAELLDSKCYQLAEKIKSCKNIVVYTGAGISTAASIPDYRGPNGIWTLLKKGQEPRAQDLSDAEPTSTHMSISKLQQQGHISYVVSQNCDGLHLRSGFPRNALSEVHGNMYLETCYSCKPKIREYVRLFDVTEKTRMRRHVTGRTCHKCGGVLKDTIVHFGEKGGMKSPYHWKKAAKAANNADMILCLGTSLKVLRQYPCLWAMDKRPSQRPTLCIVNLQWTPKDDNAALKINGRCDEVFERVMKYLNLSVPTYTRHSDPIFRLATQLGRYERDSTEKKILQMPLTISLEKTAKKGDIAQKRKVKNNHTMLRTLLNSSVANSELDVPRDIKRPKVKTEPQDDRKRADISPEVRDKLAQMLRKNPNIPIPQVFHNPMIPQLPIHPALVGLQVPFHPLDFGANLTLPSTSALPQSMHRALLLNNQIMQGQLLQNCSTFHPNLINPTSLHQQNDLMNKLTMPNYSVNIDKIQLNVRLDHNYFRKIVTRKVKKRSGVVLSVRKLKDSPCDSEDSSCDGSDTDSTDIACDSMSGHSSMSGSMTDIACESMSGSVTDIACESMSGRSSMSGSMTDIACESMSGSSSMSGRSSMSGSTTDIACDSTNDSASVTDSVISSVDDDDSNHAVKLTRAPGWYGKGLNLKRKRRVKSIN